MSQPALNIVRNTAFLPVFSLVSICVCACVFVSVHWHVGLVLLSRHSLWKVDHHCWLFWCDQVRHAWLCYITSD